MHTGTEPWSRWSGAPWHNAINPLDVNQDSRVSPHDALLIINHLMVHGAQPVPAPGVTPQSATTGDQDSGSAQTSYLDVNGDNVVSPLDALNVINLLAVDKYAEFDGRRCY